MRLVDTFIGKDGRAISSHINNAKIIDMVEISSSAELQKKLDELKKSVAKNSSATYLVVAFKQ